MQIQPIAPAALNARPLPFEDFAELDEHSTDRQPLPCGGVVIRDGTRLAYRAPDGSAIIVELGTSS